MDYRRAYWLCFLGGGLLFVSSVAMDYAEAGRLTAWIGVTSLVGVAVVGVSAYAAAYPDRAGGPTEPNARFAFAVGILLLMAVFTVPRLLAL